MNICFMRMMNCLTKNIKQNNKNREDMGTALLALCFCALSLVLALFVGISPISDKAKIRFLYVCAALSLMAVLNAAKPT